MLFRSSTIRSLIILLIANVLIYIIFLRWTTPTHSNRNEGNPVIFYPPQTPRTYESLPSSAIFQHSPMYNELAQVHFDPIR